MNEKQINDTFISSKGVPNCVQINIIFFFANTIKNVTPTCGELLEGATFFLIARICNRARNFTLHIGHMDACQKSERDIMKENKGF